LTDDISSTTNVKCSLIYKNFTITILKIFYNTKTLQYIGVSDTDNLYGIKKMLRITST